MLAVRRDRCRLRCVLVPKICVGPRAFAAARAEQLATDDRRRTTEHDTNAQGRIGPIMKITRRFTKQGQDALSSVQYEKRTSRITNPDGSVVFEMNDAEIPVQWSQLATDIMVSKYFRKAGVPQVDPATGQFFRDAQGNVVTGPEKSAKQVVHRLA